MENSVEQLKKLIRESFNGSQADFARAIKKSSSQINHWLTGYRSVGKGSKRDIEIALSLPSYWMDGDADIPLKIEQEGFSMWTASLRNDQDSEMDDLAERREFPRVVGTARMGDQGYYLDLDGGNGYLEFEAELGSIAIQVRGESMHPAIRDGWYVVIEPSGRPTPGEYVLLGFNDGRKMVKELLMEKTDCYVVMSVNSGERITAMKEELANIQAITAVVPPSKHKP